MRRYYCNTTWIHNKCSLQDLWVILCLIENLIRKKIKCKQWPPYTWFALSPQGAATCSIQPEPYNMENGRTARSSTVEFCLLTCLAWSKPFKARLFIVAWRPLSFFLLGLVGVSGKALCLSFIGARLAGGRQLNTLIFIPSYAHGPCCNPHFSCHLKPFKKFISFFTRHLE